MDQEERARFWVWEIGFTLLFGVPLYWSGLSTIGFWATFFIHLSLIVIYALLLADFGRSSNIEVGVNLLILAILASILFPVFQRARLNALRHKQKQGLIQAPRAASSRPLTRPSRTPSPTAVS